MICVFLIETSQIEVPAKYKQSKFALYLHSHIRADIHCFAHTFA